MHDFCSDAVNCSDEPEKKAVLVFRSLFITLTAYTMHCEAQVKNKYFARRYKECKVDATNHITVINKSSDSHSKYTR